MVKKGYTTYKSEKVVYDYVMGNYHFRDRCLYLRKHSVTPFGVFGMSMKDLYKIMKFKYISYYTANYFEINAYDNKLDELDEIVSGTRTDIYDHDSERYIPHWNYDLYFDINVENLIGHFINDIYYKMNINDRTGR